MGQIIKKNIEIEIHLHCCTLPAVGTTPHLETTTDHTVGHCEFFFCTFPPHFLSYMPQGDQILPFALETLETTALV